MSGHHGRPDGLQALLPLAAWLALAELPARAWLVAPVAWVALVATVDFTVASWRRLRRPPRRRPDA